MKAVPLPVFVFRSWRLLPLALAPLFSVLPILTVQGAEPSLPFSVKVSEADILNPPDYMGPGNRVDMDFPFCPVDIDGDYWVIYKNGYRNPVLRYKGATIEDAVRQPDGSASIPHGAYILGGMWYDAGQKKLYAPLHYEVKKYYGEVQREVHLASSSDKGLTWKYEGELLSNDATPGVQPNPTQFSGLYWDGGDGDHMIYVDERGGYIYLFTNNYIWPKPGSPATPLVRRRVARCAIADRMAPGKWMKFYDGAWDQPGIGGKASYVNAYDVIYDTYLKKYVSFNCSGCLSVCNDLSLQDWSPSYYLGPYWFCGNLSAIWATNELINDTAVGGQILYVYSFWQNLPGCRYRVELGPGQTPSTGGFVSPTIINNGTGNYWGADASQCYGYTPLFESSDPIDARRTRRVGCAMAENRYTGTWADSPDPAFYEGRAEVASTAGAAIDFTFTGRDIYWRAVKGPDLGMADVYLDGVLAATVDCWGNQANPFQFAFMKRGLSDGEHTLRVVLKGEKNPLSTGTAIKHMLFEYSADTYRASDGFSSISGKNQWSNEEREGTAFRDMAFEDPVWKGDEGTEVGYFQMTSGSGDAVRKWVAPHDGTVRLEGAPTLDVQNSDGVTVTVLKNGDAVWSAKLVTPAAEAASYDTRIAVQTGDSLEFIVHGNSSSPHLTGPRLEVIGNDKSLELNSRDGLPLKLGEKEFTHGLAFHAPARVIVHLPGPALQFDTTVGFDTRAGQETSGDYSVLVGGNLLFQPDLLHTYPNGRELWLDLNAPTEVTLTASAGVDWADARMVQLDGKTLWLADLPVQGQSNTTSRVLWDPVVTYVK